MTSATALKFPVAPGSLERAKSEGKVAQKISNKPVVDQKAGNFNLF